MEQPGKILTFSEDLMSTKQIIYKKYRNYFPSNPFKTVKSRHVFIIQNNFYDRYCLQHFICNPMCPDTSPIPWISTGLPHGPNSTMPLVSLKPPQVTLTISLKVLSAPVSRALTCWPCTTLP